MLDIGLFSRDVPQLPQIPFQGLVHLANREKCPCLCNSGKFLQEESNSIHYQLIMVKVENVEQMEVDQGMREGVESTGDRKKVTAV